MRIIKLRFEDKTSGWVLDEMAFHPKLTLLVGASGVGKTQILRAVKTLAEIAGGEPRPFQGISWNIEFISLNNNRYTWKGEYSLAKPLELTYEEITIGYNIICKRNNEEAYFQEMKLPRFSKEKSLMHLLKEAEIQEAYNCFSNILISVAYKNQTVIFLETALREIEQASISLEKIQESQWEVSNKFLIAYLSEDKIFDLIVNRFCSIFPSVEAIRFVQIMAVSLEEYQLQLKEKGVPNWIPQNRISSGMYKTLMHLAELYLCADGTVFLIDEFENSLGINCINEITADIINSKRQIQFIITSHHPYIINSIDFEYWKLVTRNGNVTRTHNAADLGLGKSKHERFMQLLQLEEYQTGSSQN